MKRKLILFLCLALILTGVTGCKSNEVKTEANSSETQEESKVSEETTKAYPERTIGGTVAVVEMLDLLGVEMIGVPESRYLLPESCKDAEKIGKPMNPDIEIIKSLNPDMFISVSSLQADLEKKLENSNIQSVFIENDSYDNILSSMKRLGEIYGKEKEAQEFIDEVNSKVQEILKNTKEGEKPRVMILFGSPKSIMLATKKSFVGSLVKEIGAVNIADEIGDFEDSYVSLSMEDVLKLQPDVILRLTHANPKDSKKMFEKEFSENQIWQKFEAVKNDNVYDLDNKYFGVSGNIRIVGAVEELSKILYETN